jgi:hypothetical protein
LVRKRDILQLTTATPTVSGLDVMSPCLMSTNQFFHTEVVCS